MMTGDLAEMRDNGAGKQLENGADGVELLAFSERIAHLQRRVRIQRGIIERLAARDDGVPVAAMEAMIRALAELEERNLTLEDALKAARRTGAASDEPAPPLPTPPDAVPQADAPNAPPDLEALVRTARLEAEDLRAAGEYKRARQLLRRVGGRKALKGIGLQYLANSKYRLVRKIFSFYRYG